VNTAPLSAVLTREDLSGRIIREYGSPTYVYVADRLRENIHRTANAMRDGLSGFQLLYAIKANQNPVLLRVMQESYPDLGVDCSSPGELQIALNAGFDRDHLIYTGNYESREDLEYVLATGIPVNFDDLTSYQRCREIGLPEIMSFRINPGEGKGAYPGITTAGKNVKFGVLRAKALEAYRMAIADGIQRFGLHTMVGSGILDNDYFPWNCRRMLEIARELETSLDIQFEFIDMGGGFGIPYRETDTPLDTEKIFREVGEVVEEFYPGDSGPRMTYELGRYLVGDAGFILATVTGIKENDQYFAGLDIGMNGFLRPALYGAYHRIIPLGNTEDRVTRITEITGQICENTDRTARERKLPELHPGDYVAIMDTGAYGFCFASQYNGRPLPAEVLLDNDRSYLIRQRESLDDLNRNVIIPEPYDVQENR